MSADMLADMSALSAGRRRGPVSSENPRGEPDEAPGTRGALRRSTAQPLSARARIVASPRPAAEVTMSRSLPIAENSASSTFGRPTTMARVHELSQVFGDQRTTLDRESPDYIQISAVRDVE